MAAIEKKETRQQPSGISKNETSQFKGQIPRVFTLNEASELTGMSYSMLRRLCIAGEIKCIRPNGWKFLITDSSLYEYLSGGKA